MEARHDDAEDKRLMAALAAGDDLALNELMRRWQRPVRTFVLRYLTNPSDADDLTQETFVRVFRHRTRYRPASRFSTWLFTIAVNLCRNHAEKMARRATVPLDPAPQPGDDPDEVRGHQHASPEPGPDAQTLADERTAVVRAAIHALPHELRTAVLLFEYEDLSHVEIAGIVGTTPKAIETRLYRARAALREQLAAFLKS